MMAMLLSASDVKLMDAFLYALVGFIIVLAVLALLVGIFYLTGFIFRTKAMSKEKLFERKKRDKVVATASDGEQDDEELVAAITAAISCMLESETPEVKPDFVIRRIARKK